MSTETNKWTELSQPQSEFFKAHLAALGQMGSTAVAQEAGIQPLTAAWYGINRGGASQQSTRAVAWPDPYQRETFNVALIGPHSTTPSSFARIVETPTSYETEGVAVNLNLSGKGDRLYGNVVTLKHDIEGPIPAVHLGAQFLSFAAEKSAKMSRQAVLPATLSYGAEQQFQVVGIEGQATGRLFRSLSSYAANLTVAGAFAEQGDVFSSETYDLARALLKKTIRGVNNQTDPGNAILLADEKKRVHGAAFESDHNGITVISQPPNGLAGVIIASAQRPRLGEDMIFVEQYRVHAQFTQFDSMVLPGEAYTIPHITAALGSITNAPAEKMSDDTAPAILNEPATQILEDKIMGLMQERVQLSR